MPAGILARVTCALVCAVIAGLLNSAATRAETTLAGDRASLRVAVADASVAEVLAALGARFDLSFRASAALDHQLNGSYSGSLHSVLSRVLNGYDFIIKTEAEHIDVIVVGVTM